MLDDRLKNVYVQGNSKDLTPKLFNLLKVFLSHPGKVFSPEEIAATLWPKSDRADPEDVKQYIYQLRNAIEPDPSKPRWIQNVRGFGYQLIIGEEQDQATPTASIGENPSAVAG